MKMQEVERVNLDDFKYLGSTIQSNGQWTREIKKVKFSQGGVDGDGCQG